MTAPENPTVLAIRAKICADPNGGILGKTVMDLLAAYDSLAEKYADQSTELAEAERRIEELESQIESLVDLQLRMDDL
jgi:hypothetical protein